MSTLPNLIYILKVVPTNEKLPADETGKVIHCRIAETILNLKKKKKDKVRLNTPFNIKAYYPVHIVKAVWYLQGNIDTQINEIKQRTHK